MNVCVLSRQSGRVPRALSSTSHLVPAARSALQPDLTHRALSSRYYNRYLGINICFTLLDLLPLLTVLFFSSRTKEKGRREDRGESGLSSSWLPFITVRISLLTHSHAHIHTYTQSEKTNSATYMLTKYLHEACQVHWESSDSWLAAEDGAVWSAVAWRRAAPFAAQTMNCWHEALTVYMDMTWPWHTSASGQISLLFILLCACVGVSECVCVCVWSKQHRQPNIYFRWEEKGGKFDWSWICGNVKLRCLPTVKW